uniref:Uncharacterized protein n=1 Tax=Panagrolaimus sp. ES5 TaxID=591445 RepID=A0AC34GMZ7_9BILA
MRRNRESSITSSKKKMILTFDERKKIIRKINIFGSSTSSITGKYDAADFLHAEFSLKVMPLSILMKTLHVISAIYSQEKIYDHWLILPATKILHGIISQQKNPKVLNVIIGDVSFFGGERYCIRVM